MLLVRVFQGLGRLFAMAAKGQKIVRRINTLVNGQVSCPLSGQILTPTEMHY